MNIYLMTKIIGWQGINLVPESRLDVNPGSKQSCWLCLENVLNHRRLSNKPNDTQTNNILHHTVLKFWPLLLELSMSMKFGWNEVEYIQNYRGTFCIFSNCKILKNVYITMVLRWKMTKDKIDQSHQAKK